MGYPSDPHIQQFLRGKKLHQAIPAGKGTVTLLFTDGESLRLSAIVEHDQPRILATPYRADGEVKQSTEISEN